MNPASSLFLLIVLTVVIFGAVKCTRDRHAREKARTSVSDPVSP